MNTKYTNLDILIWNNISIQLVFALTCSLQWWTEDQTKGPWTQERPPSLQHWSKTFRLRETQNSYRAGALFASFRGTLFIHLRSLCVSVLLLCVLSVCFVCFPVCWHLLYFLSLWSRFASPSFLHHCGRFSSLCSCFTLCSYFVSPWSCSGILVACVCLSVVI